MFTIKPILKVKIHPGGKKHVIIYFNPLLSVAVSVMHWQCYIAY